MKRSPQIVLYSLAGHALRITRAFVRSALLGLLGASAVTLGAAWLVSAVFGRDVGTGVGLLVAGGFLMLIGRAVNGPPPAPRRDEDG